MDNTDARNVKIYSGDITAEDAESLRTAGRVAWDIETSGLDWRGARIALCQLCVPSGSTTIVKISDERPRQLAELLTEPSVLKVFHHAMFDLRFMSWQWNVKPRTISCTKIAAKLLDPHDRKAHSLKAILSEYLRVEIEKKERLSNWLTAELSDAQLAYAVEDVRYLLKLLDVLERRLATKGLSRLAQACFEHIPTRVELELRGYSDVYAYETNGKANPVSISPGPGNDAAGTS